MAKIKKEEENKEVSAETSKNTLNALLKGSKEDHYCEVERKQEPISSGSLILNSLIKVRSGNVVRLAGKGAELGKTSQCIVFAGNYMKVMPKSKSIFIMAESRLSKDIQERSGEKFVFSPDDWEYGTIFVLPCNIFETVAQTLETLLNTMHENGEYLCIILDSLDMLQLRGDKNKNVWGGTETPKVAGSALLTKLLFKRIGLKINFYDALLLVTSQYSQEIKIDPYAVSAPRQVESSGGANIQHQSDYVLSYLPRYNSDLILESPDEKPDIHKNKTLGLYSTIEIKKSGTDVTGSKVKIPIRKGVIGCAIWKEREVGDLLLAWQVITKKGAWLSFSPDIIAELKENNLELKEQIHGLNNLFIYLEENPEICKYFHDKFSKMLS